MRLEHPENSVVEAKGVKVWRLQTIYKPIFPNELVMKWKKKKYN